jgi:hypothetical protein
VTDCYAPVGSSVTLAFRYETAGAPGASGAQLAVYEDHVLSYSIGLGANGYSASYANAAGFGQTTMSRNTNAQNTSTSSTFSTYVARDAGNYTFVSPNTASFSPRLATSVAVPGDNFYGDLYVGDIRLNLGASSAIFADLLVPGTFGTADLNAGSTNFAISLFSDFAFGNQAAYTFGGGLQSVIVRAADSGGPETQTPEPASLALFGAGLAGLLATRRGRARA